MSKESSRELLKVILKMGGDSVNDEISIELALQEILVMLQPRPLPLPPLPVAVVVII